MYDIKNEIRVIHSKYGLVGYKNENGYSFYGTLALNHQYNEVVLVDEFYICLEVSYNFPIDIPIVKDILNRIDNNFHKIDTILCLACNADISLKLNSIANTTICDFIELFVIPYFYSYKYYETYGTVPFGERRHGCLGIIDFYNEYFNITKSETTMNILKYLTSGNYKGHHYCPCGSKKIIRKCHGLLMVELLNIVGINRLKEDHNIINDEKKKALKYKNHLNQVKKL